MFAKLQNQFKNQFQFKFAGYIFPTRQADREGNDNNKKAKN